jgi:hypothetical protein
MGRFFGDGQDDEALLCFSGSSFLAILMIWKDSYQLEGVLEEYRKDFICCGIFLTLFKFPFYIIFYLTFTIHTYYSHFYCRTVVFNEENK